MAVNKDKVIASAQKYVEKGQYDKAIKEYLKVVQDDPKDIRIWLKVGDLYAKKGANAEAVETYEKVAQTYSEQGFYLKAVAVYKQILKLEPRRVEVNLRLAELYKQLGLLSDAMQQFELAANFFAREGRTRDSLDAIKQIVDMDPDNVATRIKLAESYSKEGLNREAIEEFRRAADQLRSQNRTEDFIKVAERLAWHKPDDNALAKELAALYIRRQDPRRALTKLQTCFKADPRDPPTLELLVEAFQALGQRQKVLSVLKELAKVLHENGQLEPRDRVYKRILDLEPEDDEARRALGLGLGRKPGRATEYLQAIEHHEDEISAEIDEEALLAGAHPGADDVSDEILVSEQEDGVAVEIADSSPAADEPEHSRRRGLAAGAARAPREPAQRVPTRLSDAGSEFGGENVEQEIARILTETDVYIKYGLHDKAIEHLGQVFDRDPGNLAGHEKVKDLYAQTGRSEEAVQELLWLADATRETRPEDAAQYLREALDLEPTNARARALLVEVTGREEPLRAPEGEEGPTELPPEELLPEDVGIEVEEPTSQVPPNEFDEEVSSAIELYPDEIEFEEDLAPEGEPGAPEPARFGDELAPRTQESDAPIESSAPTRRGPHEGAIAVPLDPEDELRFGRPPEDEMRSVPTPIPSGLDEEETPPETGGIEDDLEEADFFVQQGLADQARELLEDLLTRYPAHPLILAKLRDVGALEGSQPGPPTMTPLPVEEIDEERVKSSGVLELSRRAVVEKQIGEEDFETHYDLGIAYKEMGLYEDAIHEFRLVMKAPGREVLCHTMIGMCFSEKGQQTEAISQFKKGLYVEGITEREQLSLYFELGVAYEKLKDWREALYYFEKVQKRDAKFREVERRIRALKGALSASGGRGGGNGGNGSAGGKRGDDVEDTFEGLVNSRDEAET